MLLPLYIWSWGLADAALFILYSVAIGTFYVGIEMFLIDGLPFANPPKRGSGFLMAPLVIGALLAAGLIVALQWLVLFQSRALTMLATMLLGLAGLVIARLSLQHLETNVLHNLHLIAAGRNAMFKEVD